MKAPNEIDRLLSEAEALSAEIADGTLDLVDHEVTSLRADDIVRDERDIDMRVAAPDVKNNLVASSNVNFAQMEVSDSRTSEVDDALSQTDTARTSEPIPSVDPELAIAEQPVNDPIRAVEQAQTQLNELNDLLHDPDAELRKSSTELGRTADVSHANEQAPVEFSNDSSEAIENDAPRSAFRDESAANNLVPIDASPVANSVGDVTPTVHSPSEAGPRSDHPAPAPANALRKRIGCMIRIAAVSTKDGVILFLNAMLNLMTFFDLPVRKLSVRSKHTIGIIGLVTLFMGVLAWALPPLLRHNPFEKLDPGIAVPSTNSHAATGQID